MSRGDPHHHRAVKASVSTTTAEVFSENFENRFMPLSLSRTEASIDRVGGKTVSSG